ncbi:MAG: hypothetical protein AAB423_01410 [Patescibacteria group bacterium]
MTVSNIRPQNRFIPAIEFEAQGLSPDACEELGAYEPVDAAGMIALRRGIIDGVADHPEMNDQSTHLSAMRPAEYTMGRVAGEMTIATKDFKPSLRQEAQL